MDNIVLKFFYAPGDCLVFTNSIRDLKLAYPNLNVDVITPYPEIFYKNINITKIENKDKIIDINFNGGLSFQRYLGESYSEAMYGIVKQKTNLFFNSTSMFPDIFLTEEERDRERILFEYGIKDNFWLFNASIKNDIPLKLYPPFQWSKVISELKKRKINLIQTGSVNFVNHDYDCISLVGKTEDLRKFMVLCYHADGFITHNSLPMHIMAAFKKPCVVISGGRENPRWCQYAGQQFLHSVGSLNCCKDDGCWRSQRGECLNLVGYPSYPKCMTLISYKEVVNAVLKY